MAAVKTGTDPKRRTDFLDTMEEEMRRVSEHLERRERRLGLKSRRSTAGEIVNGYSFSEGSGAEAGARRRRINRYPRTLKPSEDERSWTSSPDTTTTRSPSPGPRSAPPDRPPPRFSEQLPPTSRSDVSSSASENASPAARSTPERWSQRDGRRSGSSEEGGEEPRKYVTTSNRDRRSTSNSPLRSPPPVAPKPRSRGSPAPQAAPHRPRAGSAPPSHRPSRIVSSSRERKEESKAEEKVAQEEAAVMEESPELLESGPTPVPIELSEQPISPSVTPEPSEPLLVVHQTTREQSSTPESLCSTLSPCPSTPSAGLEVGETRTKEAASPGIIEISGHFSFAKKRTLERRGEEGEMKEGGLERVEEEKEEEVVESALLEAMMEEGEEREKEEEECRGKGGVLEKSSYSQTETVEIVPQMSNDDITTTNPAPLEPPHADPRGLEVKTLPVMSPGRGRRVSPGQQRKNQELALAVKELQLQLREKEEELGRQRRVAEREARERAEQVERLEREAQKLEKEKWELLKRARDGAERALHLQTQVGVKETQLRSLQADLGRTRDEMMSVKSANTSLRALLSELRTPKPTKDVGVQVSLGHGTLRRNTSMELAVQELSQRSSQNLERGVDFRASTTNLDRGANHRISNCSAMSEGWSMTQGAWERSSERWEREQSVTSVSSSLYEPGSREETPAHSPHSGRKAKKKKGHLFGKLRKSTGKRGSTPTIIDGVDLSQSSLVQGHSRAPIAFPYHTRVGAETQEHWRLLEEAERVPFNLWNGSTIVAWVSTGLGMSQYVSAVREHITMGNALLALSDSDMDKKLGLSNPLHRRKLRLAIEERRRPDRVRYPLAGRIDCGWLAEVWVSDIGLPQFSDVISTHLVDGRVLESLTKDDLKKYFKFKKLEQMSFLSGVELLRMHDYNREIAPLTQVIQEIRASQQSRSAPQNPLYWTNRDVGDWVRDIQLGDYATNLLQSGVHGAMLFLEKDRFSSDQLAQVLQLPSGKHVARKHLAQQMSRLFRDEGTEHLYISQQNSMMSFQSNPGGNSPLSPPFSGSLYRAGSSPSLNQTGVLGDRLSMEDRIRHSLRESALRSVISPRTPSPSSSPTSQFSHPPSPHLPSAPSPLTQTKASSTTV